MLPAKQRSGRTADAPGSADSSYRVEVTNETDSAVDAARLAAAVQIVLADAELTSAEVSVAVVDDATIHRLNRQFLEHDYPTDVLSFVLDAPPQLSGEIIASVDTAAREAAEVGWPAEHELLLYAVHGALHLVGQLDKDPADAAEMRARERETLVKLGVTVSPTDPRWSHSLTGDGSETPAS
jgi:probable rRNA maturation factor